MHNVFAALAVQTTRNARGHGSSFSGMKGQREMAQSEYDALFFDQVYGDVNVKEELAMEGFALNYVLAEFGLMS